MKRFIKILAVALAVCIIAVGSYAAYVFIAYYRLPDMLELEVEGDNHAKARPDEVYTAVSYNVGFGAYSADFGFFMDGGDSARARSGEEVRENIGGALDTLALLDADVIFIQELDVDGDRSRHVNQVELTDAAFPEASRVFAQNYDSPYLFYPLTEPIGRAQAGIMTVSRFGITSAMRRSLPIDTGVMKLVDLDRCYSVSRADVENGRELVMYNVHLSAYTADESIVRGQLEMLCADMAAEYAAGNYVLCGGDFNCDLPGDSKAVFGVSGDFGWAQPFNTALLPEGFSLAASLNRDAPVPSSRNADGPYVEGESFVVTLDGFIVSDNVRVLEAGVEDTGFAYSDHNPVYIRFILTDAQE